MNMSLRCDVCKGSFKYSEDVNDTEAEILHFSGILNGKFNHHMHICVSCVQMYEIRLIEVRTEPELEEESMFSVFDEIPD